MNDSDHEGKTDGADDLMPFLDAIPRAKLMDSVSFQFECAIRVKNAPRLVRYSSPTFLQGKNDRKKLKIQQQNFYTVKPRFSAPVFNIFPPKEHTNIGPKKNFYGYSYVGNKKNLCKEHNFDQSFEIC